MLLSWIKQLKFTLSPQAFNIITITSAFTFIKTPLFSTVTLNNNIITELFWDISLLPYLLVYFWAAQQEEDAVRSAEEEWLQEINMNQQIKSLQQLQLWVLLLGLWREGVNEDIVRVS